MTSTEDGNPRTAIKSRAILRRRTADVIVLSAASSAFLFTLAIAFGLISG